MYVDRKTTAHHLLIALLFLEVISSATVKTHETDNTLLVASPLAQISLKSYLHPPSVKTGLVVLLYVRVSTSFPGLLTSSHPSHPHLAYRCPYSFISGCSRALLVLASCLRSVPLQFPSLTTYFPWTFPSLTHVITARAPVAPMSMPTPTFPSSPVTFSFSARAWVRVPSAFLNSLGKAMIVAYTILRHLLLST